MKTKRIPTLITILFFFIMIFMTFTARSIHNSIIPNVTVFRLPHVKFEYVSTLEDGSVSYIEVKQLLAIPKDLYEQGEIYIIEYQIINGEERTVAKLTNILIGEENNDYYEATNQGISNSLFIKSSNQAIQDGDEVHVLY